ncbi:MAG: hypothetical protein R6U55_03035 [Desulfovermiculus sp.]
MRWSPRSLLIHSHIGMVRGGEPETEAKTNDRQDSLLKNIHPFVLTAIMVVLAIIIFPLRTVMLPSGQTPRSGMQFFQDHPRCNPDQAQSAF